MKKNGNHNRILIVDDEEMVLYVLKRSFEMFRPKDEVVTVVDGMSALAMVEQFAFDLVITDYLMPEMNGLDLVSQLQHIAPKTPVVLMTGSYTTDIEDGVKQAKLAKCLKKPFTPMEMLETVEGALKHANTMV